MKKIPLSFILRLNGPQTQQFMSVALDLYRLNGALELSLQERVEDLDKALKTLGTDFKVQKRHELTPELNDLDEKRSKALVGLKKEIESLQYRSEEDVIRMGRFMLENYNFNIANIYDLKIPDKTANIQKLIKEWNTIPALAEGKTTHNLTHWFTTLESNNTEFYQKYLERQNSLKQKSEMKDKRTELKILLEELVMDTQAHSRLSKNKAEYEAILLKIKVLATKYAAMVKTGKTDKNQDIATVTITEPDTSIT